MKGLKIVFASLVVLVVLAVPSLVFSLEKPWGQNNFVYSAVVHPVIFEKSAPICKPIGVGSIREGNFALEITLPRFDRPVDLYVAMVFPETSFPYMLLPDNSLRSISEVGLRPWKQNIQGPISQGVFWGALSQVPQGRYDIYLAALPANEQSFRNYFCWQTYFEIVSPASSNETPQVAINFPRNVALSIGSILALDVRVTNPQSLSLLEFFIDGNLLMQHVGVPSQTQYFFYYDCRGMVSGAHQVTVQAKGFNNGVSTDSLGFTLNPEIRRQALNVLGRRNSRSSSEDPTQTYRVVRWLNLPIFLEATPEVTSAMGLQGIQQSAEVLTVQTGIPIRIRPNINFYIEPFARNPMQSVIFVRGVGEWLSFYIQLLSFSGGQYLEHMDYTRVEFCEYGTSIVELRISAQTNFQELLDYELVFRLGILGDFPDNRSWGYPYITGYVNGRLDPVFGEALRMLYWELCPGSPLPSN